MKLSTILYSIGIFIVAMSLFNDLEQIVYFWGVGLIIISIGFYVEHKELKNSTDKRECDELGSEEEAESNILKEEVEECLDG